jgi:hypothetical protein
MYLKYNLLYIRKQIRNKSRRILMYKNLKTREKITIVKACI